MDLYASSPLISTFRRVPTAASWIVILIACLTLAGWVLDLATLRSIFPGWPQMAPVTALGLMLSGVSLWLLRAPVDRRRLRLAQGGAWIVVVTALLTLSEGLFGWLDRWLLPQAPGINDGVSVGRMSLNSTLSFLLAGSALLLLDVETRRGWRPAPYLALVIFMIALLALLGYGYGAFSAFVSYPGLALPTALGFVLLSAGLLCARPDRGLTALMTSQSAGGFMARRLLGAAVAIPALLGWLKVLAQGSGHYDTAFGVSLLVTANIIVFLIVVWRNAESLDRLDSERQRAEEARRQAYGDLERRVETRTAELAAANAELRRSQEELADFFENATVGLHWAGPDGRILWANRAELDLLGYAREEYIGRHIAEFYADQEAIADVLQRLARGETLNDYEARLRAKDGSIKYVLLSSNVLWKDGEFIHARCFTRDITEQKQAEEDSARLLASAQAARAQAEQASEMIRRLQAVTDSALQHLALDDLLREMLNRIRELLNADSAAILLLTEDRQNLTVRAAIGLEEEVAAGVCVPVGQGIAGRIAANRAPLIVDDLSMVEVANEFLRDRLRSLIGAPLMIENRVIGVIHADTVEARRFTQDDLRLLQLVADRVALAIEQAHLYEAEQRARVQAEEANRTKDEFLATVSHELRSPLNAILGWARLLREGRLGAEAATRALETIERSARSQNRIINDLLDVSRIIAGKLRLNVRPIEPARIVGAAVEAVRPAAEAKAIRLQMVLDQEAGPISGDSDRLQQIVWNLVSNAIKFTPKGGRVQVRLERVSSHIEIVISDTGIGIRPEFLPYVFDRFRQADGSSTRKHGGLGLGLAIVRHLVELHGGTVQVESQGEGQGATFIVKLPLMISRVKLSEGERMHPTAEGKVELNYPPQLDGLRVLVVDDDPDARDLIAMILTQCEAKVETTASAAEALAILSERELDVLISDIEMPEADGYELIRQVRARELERGGRLPALALTAYARLEDRMRVLAAGFQMHVAKPVDPHELVTVVASIAGRIGQNARSRAV